MRLYLFLLSFGVSFSALSQTADTAKSISKPIAPVLATINNLGFKKVIYISKDSFRNGFKLILSDSSYEIVRFSIVFFGRYMDAYSGKVLGSVANETNLPIFKNLYSNDKMQVTNIVITKDKKLFDATPFMIVIK